VPKVLVPGSRLSRGSSSQVPGCLNLGNAGCLNLENTGCLNLENTGNLWN